MYFDIKVGKVWINKFFLVIRNDQKDRANPLVLGHNVFTGNDLGKNKASKITNPANLLTANDPWTKDKKNPNDWQGAPGLYVVA